MKSFKLVLTSFILGIFAVSVYAEDCPQFYPPGVEPVVVTKHVTLCNELYKVEYSPTTKTPIYSMHIVTKKMVTAAKEIGRRDDFSLDNRLSVQATPQATLLDYKYSGYDRGHLVPSDDMPTYETQHETFLLSNIIPQNPASNRGLWKSLENQVRNYTNTEYKVYVMSGPIYDNLTSRIGNDVKVPQRLFKIIWLPDQNRTIVLIVSNSQSKQVQVSSLKELETLVPIRFKVN